MHGHRCTPCGRRAESGLTVGVIYLLWQDNDDATLTVIDAMAILSRCGRRERGASSEPNAGKSAS
jgi:hypothetical protein